MNKELLLTIHFSNFSISTTDCIASELEPISTFLNSTDQPVSHHNNIRNIFHAGTLSPYFLSTLTSSFLSLKNDTVFPCLSTTQSILPRVSVAYTATPLL